MFSQKTECLAEMAAFPHPLVGIWKEKNFY